MKPHTGYRALWIFLHASGAAACHLAGLWDLYFGTVAVLEGISLARKLKGRDGSGTFSWTVWAFLEPSGWSLLLRVPLVAVWSLWFCGAFGMHGWFRFGPTVGAEDSKLWVANLLAAGAFLVWLWLHFFGRRKAARAPSVPPRTDHSPPPGIGHKPFRRGATELDPEHDGAPRPSDGGGRRTRPT